MVYFLALLFVSLSAIALALTGHPCLAVALLLASGPIGEEARKG